MTILEYFSLSEAEQARWREEIGKGDWRAAAFLRDRLAGGSLGKRYGKGARVLLGVSDYNALMGFCTLAPRDDVAETDLTPWIGFVYTFPPFRGNRLSGVMIERACALARADGFDWVYLSTREIGLYEKYGFEFLETARDAWGGETQIYRRKI